MGRRHTVLLAAAAVLCAGFLLWYGRAGSPGAGGGRTVYGRKLQDADGWKKVRQSGHREEGRTAGKQKSLAVDGTGNGGGGNTQGSTMGINLSHHGATSAGSGGILFATGRIGHRGSAVRGGNVETVNRITYIGWGPWMGSGGIPPAKVGKR